MAGQFLDDAGKIGAKAVADDRVRRLELEPGDEVGVDRDGEIERPAERLGESVAAGLRFLGAERAAAAVSRARPRRPSPSRLASGSDASASARPSMKPSTRAESGRRAKSLAAMSTASLAARSEAAESSADARPAHFGRGGRAQMLDFRAGGGERRGALGLARRRRPGAARCRALAAILRALRLGRLARRDRAASSPPPRRRRASRPPPAAPR